MNNVPQYSLLGGEGRAGNRLSWKPLLFGFIVGIFLSNIALFESETNANSSIYEGIGRRHDYSRSGSTNVSIRCIILVQSTTEKPDKFISAIRDTYSKRCNETLFFTSNKELEKQFASEVNIYHVGDNLDQRKYPMVHDILRFIQAEKHIDNSWTILMNEQNYLVAENMRNFISKLPSNEPSIAGKITDITYVTDVIFSTQTEMFQLDAGIVISPLATKIIIDDTENCSPSKWTTPLYTGKALLRCARKANFRIWDPIDEEDKRLFLGKSPRNLFAQSNYVLQGKSFEESRQASDCCSDKAVIFGLVNYRDQRVLDYALQSVRVFGL